ncbi:hypothetical protein [Microbacterium sp. Se63.02b]|uniref:hypothetical protein n=1 Tax=Microbacterium sp. Se63.02b TaxID=2709304 RepID=UPI001FCE62CF|nr:hypothetical protein [Microbacterium sp. Se63.02b]
MLAAAAELGYAGPDPRAASLRRGRSGIVAVVLEGHLRAAFLDPVTTAMMDGLTDGLAELSSGILLMRDDPGDDGAAIASAPVDAFVLIGCSGRTRASLEVVVGRGLPVVVIEGDAGSRSRASRSTTPQRPPTSLDTCTISVTAMSRSSRSRSTPTVNVLSSPRRGSKRRRST